MKEQVTGRKPAASDASRLLRARLDLAMESVPGTIWVNPSWALVTIIPFTGLFPVFGTASPLRLVFVLGMHVVNSVIGAWLLRKYRQSPTHSESWIIRFLLFQGLVGISWGMFTWLLWQDGNGANNVLLFVNVVVILWSYALSRSMQVSIFLASVGPAVLISGVRFITAPGPISSALVYMLVISFLFVLIMARGVHVRANRMLRTGMANQDLTDDLREARDDALRKRFEAEAANASKTTFLANMSHELRTPLNAILGFSELIAHETLGPVGTVRYRDYASDIHASGNHLLSIINDILDIAKIEAGKMSIEPRPIAPRTVIEKALAVILGRARDKRQHVVVNIPDEQGMVMVDERALKQIIINLLSNAVKYTPEGGQIAVSGQHSADGGFLLCVEDNGPGISEALLERVFTPFNQIDNRYNRQSGGTGLGLSLVRGLAELHGGRAWIESEVGAGVRAFVYFPAGEVNERQTQEELRASA